MIQALFEAPSTYRPTPGDMAAPVPQVEAVLFDFSNTIFQMIDLEAWLHRVGAASGRLARLNEPDAVAEISQQLRQAFQLPAVAALQEGRDLSRERHRLAMRGWWRHVDFLRGVEETAYRELTAPDAWLPYPDTDPTLRARASASSATSPGTCASDPPGAGQPDRRMRHLQPDRPGKAPPPPVPQGLRGPRRRPPGHPHGRRQPHPGRWRHRLRPAGAPTSSPPNSAPATAAWPKSSGRDLTCSAWLRSTA